LVGGTVKVLASELGVRSSREAMTIPTTSDENAMRTP
jgi:hypothetical protein